MSETNFLEMQTANKRSTMLTVICILTFIGSLGGIANHSFALTGNSVTKTAEAQAQMERDRKQIELQKSKGENSGSKFALKMMEASKEMLDPAKRKTIAIWGLIANVLTLAGAILMWIRKRPGFWIYVAGTIIPIGTMAAVYGTANLINNLSMGFFILIAVVFIILYAMCLKEMKPNLATDL